MRLLQLLVIFTFFTTTARAQSVSLSVWGCPERCGNITVPYPFGIGLGCSYNSSFSVTCHNHSSPPRLFFSSINLQIQSISIQDGTIQVMQRVSPLNCSSELRSQSLVHQELIGTPFIISAHYNSLTILGCSNSFWLTTNETMTPVRCTTFCNENSIDDNCCYTNISLGLQQQLQVSYQTINRSVSNNNSSRFCGYAFLADSNWFQNDYGVYNGHLLNSSVQEFVNATMVLEWQFEWLLDNPEFTHHSSCKCRGRSIPFLSPPYCPSLHILLCSCESGFEGNPYLPNGCQDINECNYPATNYCPASFTCINELGYYTCQNRDKIVFISIGIGLGGLFLLLGLWMCIKAISRRVKAICKRKFFKRNGGLLLQQQLSSSSKDYNNSLVKMKLFSSNELAQATDHYNENRVLGRGGQGTVYKGMLTDGKIVAVKKSKMIDEGELKVFINEVAIVSQINHRNVVKLFGCCLETEVPMLVYEFVPNGTLHQHIHGPSEEEYYPLTWDMRVRIATEIAGALAYLHSASSTPIYHRDIKSTNILLDEKYKAKISDFGTSRSIGIDQTHLTTRVLGTFGYMDPEYFRSSQFTEKSDVYSFGVVMVELLTGEKAVTAVRAEEGRSLAMHFLDSMEKNQLFDILDAKVVREGDREEIEGMAELSKRCLHLNGKRRPTMKEVAAELESILRMKREGQQQNYHELEYSSTTTDDEVNDGLGDIDDLSTISESTRLMDTTNSSSYFSIQL